MTEKDETDFLERREYARLYKEFVVRIVEVEEERSPAARAGKTADDNVGVPRDPVSDQHPFPFTEGTVNNISLGGVRLLADRIYLPGSTLILELLLPEMGPHRLPAPLKEKTLMRARCRVVWADSLGRGEFAHGLRFIQLSEEQLKSLSHLLTQGNL
jgi:hypothetical protein